MQLFHEESPLRSACGKGSLNTFNHQSDSDTCEIWEVWTQTRYLQKRWVDTVDDELCLSVRLRAMRAVVSTRLHPGAKAMNQTALFYAARRGHVETIRYLMSKGLDPNVVDAAGETALLGCQ